MAMGRRRTKAMVADVYVEFEVMVCRRKNGCQEDSGRREEAGLRMPLDP